MAFGSKVPGIHREERVVVAAGPLMTGVAGFVGFGRTLSGAAERLQHVDQLVERWVAPTDGVSYLSAAVRGYFANGGKLCYVVGAGELAGSASSLIAAVETLAPETELDLVAVPDAMVLGATDAAKVQRAAVAHCTRHGDRFAILDAPLVGDGSARVEDVARSITSWRDDVTDHGTGSADGANAALYFPWLRSAGSDGLVPPCGHVAGVIARSDARVGVFKAPANEELFDVVDLGFPVDDHAQSLLHPEGINCLRAMPGRGLRVWGARTLSLDPAWRYISVRRVFLTLSRWVVQSLAWAAFEPNTPRLWNRLVRELTGYLERLWRAGALKGNSASEAFYVRCDAELNPPERIEQGSVIAEIGFAPTLPAEFVIVHIVQRAGVIELG